MTLNSQAEIARRILKDAPRWLFLAALIYAPWAYGCTTPRAIVLLDWILDAVFLLWSLHLVIARRVPDVPKTLLVLCGALLLLGWWMVLNARWIYDSDYYLFVPITHLSNGLPGSVDQAVSAAWMLRATALLFAICFVADLTQRPVWLLRLWWTIGIAGGSIALLGLLQKATGAPMIFWQPARVHGMNTFFGTYYYHANAGAFLNLVLPLVWGLAMRTFLRPARPVERALWLAALVILLVAIFSDTSRMAQLIAVLLIVLLATLSLKLVRLKANGLDSKRVILSAALIALALLAVAQASHLGQGLQRWQQTGGEMASNGRWLAYRAASRAVGDAGFFGFGPGTFAIIFPYYTADLGREIANVWLHLHEDYLQTLLEWGWVGSALWAALFFGGMAMALRRWREQRRLRQDIDTRSYERPGPGLTEPHRYRQLLPLVLLGLGGVAIHALVDFPLQIASIQFYAATYLGLCWRSSGERKSR